MRTVYFTMNKTRLATLLSSSAASSSIRRRRYSYYDTDIERSLLTFPEYSQGINYIKLIIIIL